MMLNIPDRLPLVGLGSHRRFWLVDLANKLMIKCQRSQDIAGAGGDAYVGYGAKMIGPVRVDYEVGTESPHGFYCVLTWFRVELLGLMFEANIEASGEELLDDGMPTTVYGSWISIGRGVMNPDRVTPA